MAAAIQVHDIVRVTPKPIEGKVVGTATAGMDDVMVSIRIDGVEYAADAYDFELIDRPEAPKPAAKVGDVVSRDITEPPLGSVVARTVSLVEPGSKVRVRVDGGWRLATDNDSTMYWDWQGLADMGIGYTVVFIPGE